MPRYPVLLSLLLLFAPALATAAWLPNGVRMTGARDDQSFPRIVSDGAGGAFVTWYDYRAYGSGGPGTLGIECYLQHVDAAGQLVPGWPQDGLLVGTGFWDQQSAALIADGQGGAFLAFLDNSVDLGDLYLQRITAAGAVASGWPAGGVPVGVGPREQFAPELASDGAGGAWVSWQDSDGAGDSHARYTHVLTGGQLAPGWPAGGRLFEPTTFGTGRPLMLPSEAGAFMAVWGVFDNAEGSVVRMLAQRFLADGTADPAWPAGGLIACTPQFSSRGPVARLIADGTGGCYTVFPDYRHSPPGDPYSDQDIYAQHVQGDGTLAPGWPADGLPVSALATTEQDPDLCEDGQGGVFIAWEDYRSGYARAFAMHLAADGQRLPGWPAAGLSLTDRLALQLSPKFAWDGVRGAYVVWMNLESSGYRSYVRHLTSVGSSAPGWPGNGLPVISLATDQHAPVIIADGSAGAIVAWTDIRNAERDIYAQRFVTDGVVAAQVSVVTAEARADEVRLRWHVSGETRASIERSELGAAEWRTLAQGDVDGAGYLDYVDREVRAGASYEYRLGFAGGARGGETSVTVPVLELTLEGARPNPAVGSVVLAFTLPDASPARLELYDLSGRRLASRDVGTRGAGRHVERLEGGVIPPGLYWASLSQGGRTLRTRIAVVR